MCSGLQGANQAKAWISAPISAFPEDFTGRIPLRKERGMTPQSPAKGTDFARDVERRVRDPSVITSICAFCARRLWRDPAEARVRAAPATDYIEVPYPPPAAAAEVVPAQPASDAVWVDGQWAWRDRYYVWQRGGWVRPPQGAYYATWAKYYAADGTLYFAGGGWRNARDGSPLAEPVVLLPATVPPTEETPEP